ncbi:hypothetical protein [Streptomyces sp. KLOTTS4A1]|uniref:hypothetical protein n=1 Tax=Streptomyces sp. KLOTTS4A1 TaxID=3390996 RepID=UPI0039F6459F
MRCGHGWEQSYDIEHFVDGQGNEFVLYKVDGRRVPSPLSRPTCLNCGGHVVRFMRAGRVSTILDLIDHPERLGWSEKRQQAEAESLAEESEAEQSAEAGAEESAGATAESEGATAESEGAAVRGSSGAGAAPEESGHHWHLSDLLHPFKGKRS